MWIVRRMLPLGERESTGEAGVEGGVKKRPPTWRDERTRPWSS
jgi:hypothetical protein